MRNNLISHRSHWELKLPVRVDIVFRGATYLQPVLLTGTDDDLEFYVLKCGEILGVPPKLDKEQRDAKQILEYIFFQVVEFKKHSQVRMLQNGMFDTPEVWF